MGCSWKGVWTHIPVRAAVNSFSHSGGLGCLCARKLEVTSAFLLGTLRDNTKKKQWQLAKVSAVDMFNGCLVKS